MAEMSKSINLTIPSEGTSKITLISHECADIDQDTIHVCLICTNDEDGHLHPQLH